MSNRKAYSGSQRRLVLALDLGTTFSGVSFAILDPGKVPKVHTVSRYPGQEAGDAKIPTVIYYDKLGRVVAAGAEEPQTMDDGSDSEDGWEDEPLKLEWFKLLLRPQSASTNDTPIPVPQLPASKSIVDVYADFYGYLFKCARTFIQQTYTALGELMWESVETDIHFVLTHPNGWGGSQQSAMRRAAVQAGLVPDGPSGHTRITFATEGEASLHYCLASDHGSTNIQAGKKVMIIDAGGGTVDISTYAFKSTTPVTIEEIAIPACLLQGSVFVRKRAEDYIRAKLRNSAKFSGDVYVQAITNEFDRTAKKRFKGTSDASVKFSNLISDRDQAVGIRNGAIKLTKEELSGFFDPAVTAIVEAVLSQHLQASPQHGQVQTHFLVGGFAASEYLYEQLQKQLNGDGLSLFRPDAHTNKAVAEGAVSFYVDHFVSTRIARFNYGTNCNNPYQPEKASHKSRADLAYVGVDGVLRLNEFWYDILDKGTSVSETTEFRKSLRFMQASCPGQDEPVSTTFYAHPSDTEVPEFIDASFSVLCKVTASLNGVPVSHSRGQNGHFYYQRAYDVVLSFGLTELNAQIAWKANGIEQRSPATIIYDDDFAVTVAGP
ncbi:unnamed protein product [Peniophora sp. CBMAI 1063]|nr:unnamed protein product [Peniophora sp. CBMAI 1063]